MSAAVVAVGALDVDVAPLGSVSFGDVHPLHLNGQMLTKTGFGPLRLQDVSGGGTVMVQEGQLRFSGMYDGGGVYVVQPGGLFVADGVIFGDVINLIPAVIGLLASQTARGDFINVTRDATFYPFKCLIRFLSRICSKNQYFSSSRHWAGLNTNTLPFGCWNPRKCLSLKGYVFLV